jgi:hypothetical protein
MYNSRKKASESRLRILFAVYFYEQTERGLWLPIPQDSRLRALPVDAIVVAQDAASAP